ncbi:MAG: hypothetical protein Q8P39_03400 [Candidatus Yanofskybacteria bacterium]|nr:hypothetical protein [Candidatus Yanofskybacteria bacterium]
MHSKAEYVVQMRTDQFVDLRELLDSFERQVRHQRICVPFLRPGIFLASDFYIAADFSSFEDFVNAQLSHDRYEFIVDVHRDMILKYAYASFRGVLGVPDWAYFPRAPHAGMHKKTKDIFSYMLQEIFTPLSETTLRSVVWRGSPLSEEYLKEVRTEENASHEETRRSKMDAISVPALLSINWKRYYEFCRLYNKKKLSFWKEVLLIALGNVGWNGWVLLWKALKTGKRKVLWLAKRQSN